MKKLLSFVVGIVLALTAATALAADITGKWSGDMQIPDGTSIPLTFTFKQDGAKVTGTVTSPQGDALAISDGKIVDDKVTFVVMYNGMTIKHEGTVVGDQMKLSSKTDSGDFPGAEFTVKRTKEPAPQP